MDNRIRPKQYLLKEREAAELLAIRPTTLRRWRWAGKGPQFLKIGGAVRYERTTLNAFIDAAKRRSTSDVQLGAASGYAT